ncbi:MAG: SURF1 family protein [Gemmatimonadota bacterium]
MTVQITTRGVIATVLIFMIAGLCVRFGFWQLDRLAQRRERNDDVRARLEAAPVQLASAPRDSAEWLHRRVTIAGRFDNQRSIIWPGRSYAGAPGAHVVTPVLLEDGSAVLADRGWVSAADGATVNLAQLALSDTAGDTAIVVPFPGQERRLGNATPAASLAAADSGFRRVWFAVDERALRAQFPYRLGNVQVRLLPSQNAAAVPVREPAPALDEGSHLGYAIQWFSFAAIAISGWLVMVLKQRGTA